MPRSLVLSQKPVYPLDPHKTLQRVIQALDLVHLVLHHNQEHSLIGVLLPGLTLATATHGHPSTDGLHRKGGCIFSVELMGLEVKQDNLSPPHSTQSQTKSIFHPQPSQPVSSAA